MLALAPLITKDIINPLEALQPPPNVTAFKFPFGTHTGYQASNPSPFVYTKGHKMEMQISKPCTYITGCKVVTCPQMTEVLSLHRTSQALAMC